MLSDAQLQQAVYMVTTSDGTLTVGEALDKVMAEAGALVRTEVTGPTEVTTAPLTASVDPAGTIRTAVRSLIVTAVHRKGSDIVHAVINGLAGCDRFRPSQAGPIVGAPINCAGCIISVSEAKGEF